MWHDLVFSVIIFLCAQILSLSPVFFSFSFFAAALVWSCQIWFEVMVKCSVVRLMICECLFTSFLSFLGSMPTEGDVQNPSRQPCHLKDFSHSSSTSFSSSSSSFSSSSSSLLWSCYDSPSLYWIAQHFPL